MTKVKALIINVVSDRKYDCLFATIDGNPIQIAFGKADNISQYKGKEVYLVKPDVGDYFIEEIEIYEEPVYTDVIVQEEVFVDEILEEQEEVTEIFLPTFVEPENIEEEIDAVVAEEPFPITEDGEEICEE